MIPFLSKPKPLWTALAFAAATVLPAAAQSLVTTTNFSLTFPAGWMQLTAGTESDSASAFLINTLTGSTAITMGLPHQGLLTSKEMAQLMLTYGVTDSLSTTANGTKTLGGKEFTFLEFKKSGTSESNTVARVRIYFLSQGNFLFEGLMSYDTDTVAGTLTEFEAALATLNIKASAGLRAAIAPFRPAEAGARHDALGRSQRLPGTRQASFPSLVRY